MTNLEAVMDIVYESERPKRSKSGLKRLQRAGRKLNFSAEEQDRLEVRLDYRSPSTNELFPV